MDLMTVVQLVLIVFLLLVTRFLSWKVNKYEGQYAGVAKKFNTLAVKYNKLAYEHNKRIKGQRMERMWQVTLTNGMCFVVAGYNAQSVRNRFAQGMDIESVIPAQGVV